MKVIFIKSIEVQFSDTEATTIRIAKSPSFYASPAAAVENFSVVNFPVHQIAYTHFDPHTYSHRLVKWGIAVSDEAESKFPQELKQAISLTLNSNQSLTNRCTQLERTVGIIQDRLNLYESGSIFRRLKYLLFGRWIQENQ